MNARELLQAWQQILGPHTLFSGPTKLDELSEVVLAVGNSTGRFGATATLCGNLYYNVLSLGLAFLQLLDQSARLLFQG